MTVAATAARSADRRASWHSNAPTTATRRVVLGVIVAQITALGADLATQLPTREPHA